MLLACRLVQMLQACRLVQILQAYRLVQILQVLQVSIVAAGLQVSTGPENSTGSTDMTGGYFAKRRSGAVNKSFSKP